MATLSPLLPRSPHPLSRSVSASNSDFDAILVTKPHSDYSRSPLSDGSRAPSPLPEKPTAALLPPEEGRSKWERAASTSPTRRSNALDPESQGFRRGDTWDELASSEKEIREDKRHRQHAFLAVALLIVVLVIIPLALVISRSKAFSV